MEIGLNQFIDKAKILARFADEKSLITIDDFFKLNNTAYIVLEALEGQTLKDYCRENGAMTYDRLLKIMVPIINAVEKLHDKNFIHGSISPDEIIITNDGRCKLLGNFCLPIDKELQEKKDIILHPGYTAVEQYLRSKKLDARTDIYAIGTTMYYCLTGVVPDNAIERHIYDEVVPINEKVPGFSRHYSNSIMKGMSVRAEERYPNIAELKKGLLDIDPSERY